MKYILSERSRTILKNKKELERKLNIKISNKGKIIEFSGLAEQEFIAEKVIEAINLGFKIPEALDLIDEENMLQVIDIKKFSKSKNLQRVRGRIIGKRGKILDTLENLTNCSLVLKDNHIGVIGYSENVESCATALGLLIQGSKISSVYAYLEKHHPKPILDLGLKNNKS